MGVKAALSLIVVILMAGFGGYLYGFNLAKTVTITEVNLEMVTLTQPPSTLTETETVTLTPPTQTVTIRKTISLWKTATPLMQTITISKTVTVTETLIPTPAWQELVYFTLELINADRANHGLPPVKLGINQAAQKHAEEMLKNDYLSHWNLAGMKPYMRYMLECGSGAIFENVAYSGRWSEKFSPKEIIAKMEYNMMYEDEDFDWSHRYNILDRWHNKVNIGIAYNGYALALVQDFERDYVEWEEPIKYENGRFSMKGKTMLGEIYPAILLYYDPPPVSLTREQLLKPPYNKSYSMGEEAGYIIPSGYRMEEVDYVNALSWRISPSGEFEIVADITPLLKYGDGVYTLVLLAEVDGEYIELVIHSLFIQK
ncbi:TPA: CAP domain-containing protein [Candidatus Bathyarchaeota archaeon]|nr:CAP domain-containing protein [Candidatus Bathyarchaeota archaeon]